MGDYNFKEMIITNTLLLIIFGYLVIGYLLPKIDLVERLSLSFVIGIGLFTFMWYLLNLVGIKFSNTSIVFTLVISIFIFRKSFGKNTLDKKYLDNLNVIEKICILVTLFLLASSFIGDLYWPVRHWDSLTLYDFRARLFAETGFVKTSIVDVSFFGYPLLTSLMHTIAYVSNYSNPSFFYSLFYSSVIFNFYSNLKKLKINRLYVFLGTMLISISPRIFDHSLSAYTNLPYLAYYLLSTIYLYLYIKGGNFRHLIVSAVLSGLAVWTRSAEPFYIAQILILFVSSIKRKRIIDFIMFSVVLAVFIFSWRLFVLKFNWDISTVVSVPKKINYVGTFSNSLNFFIDNFVKPYLPYLIMLILITVYKIKFRLKSWYFIVVIYLDIIMIFVGTFIFVSNYQAWSDISDSLTRMSIFIPALVVFSLAELLSDSKKGYNRSVYEGNSKV